MRVGFSQLGKSEPVPEGIYRLENKGMKEKTYKSASWGFDGEYMITKSDSGSFENRRIFDSYPILGGQKAKSSLAPSGAIFRFVQAYEACTGSQLDDQAFYDDEADQWTDENGELLNIDEVKDIFRQLAQDMVNYETSAEVVIEEPSEEGYRPRNRIKKFV